MKMEQVWVSDRLVREIERRRGERDGSSALEKYVRLLRSSCRKNFRYINNYHRGSVILLIPGNGCRRQFLISVGWCQTGRRLEVEGSMSH